MAATLQASRIYGDTHYRENFSAAAGAARMARLPSQNRTHLKRWQRTGLGTLAPGSVDRRLRMGITHCERERRSQVPPAGAVDANSGSRTRRPYQVSGVLEGRRLAHPWAVLAADLRDRLAPIGLVPCFEAAAAKSFFGPAERGGK
jgi:hypothetical protein